MSDLQFTPEEQKSQSGKQFYYVAADGTSKVVITPNEYAMPNGVEISPDGKTFCVNNTWFWPGANYVWVYNIKTNSSLTNKRKFAELNLTPEVLSAKDPEYRVDSRAVGDSETLVPSLVSVQTNLGRAGRDAGVKEATAGLAFRDVGSNANLFTGPVSRANRFS